MARERSPNRDKSFEVYKKHGGKITNRAIAEELGISEKTVGGWKSKDKWDDKLNGVLQSNERSTPKKKGGASKGNQHAKGNKGGAAPKRNSNAVTHGFFRSIFPNDEETLQLVEAINEKGPLDMLWENIVIKYTAIARAQKIMFVQDKDDLTKELKKTKQSESGWEEEYELQFAWDKQATFLNAQSRAMSTLASLIKQFDDLAHKDDERRLKLQSMQLDVDKKQEELKLLEKENSAGGKETTIIVDDIGDFEDDD